MLQLCRAFCPEGFAPLVSTLDVHNLDLDLLAYRMFNSSADQTLTCAKLMQSGPRQDRVLIDVHLCCSCAEVLSADAAQKCT